MNYRKIWEDAYGPIPHDEKGRSYEIHHKDRNRKNNDLSNLECLSIEDHFHEHLKAEELAAAFLIWQRLEQEPSELYEQLRKHRIGKKAITNGTENRFVDPDEILPEGWKYGLTIHSMTHRENVRKAQIGRKVSEETKLKISQTTKGKVHSDITRKKISASLCGRIRPEEERKAVSEGLRTKRPHLSDTHKENISQARTGINFSPTHRENLAKVKTGLKWCYDPNTLKTFQVKEIPEGFVKGRPRKNESN